MKELNASKKKIPSGCPTYSICRRQIQWEGICLYYRNRNKDFPNDYYLFSIMNILIDHHFILRNAVFRWRWMLENENEKYLQQVRNRIGLSISILFFFCFAEVEIAAEREYAYSGGGMCMGTIMDSCIILRYTLSNFELLIDRPRTFCFDANSAKALETETYMRSYICNPKLENKMEG